MPIVTVFYGPAYDGKNEAVFRRCLEKIRCHQGHTCVYLVRSEVRVRQLRDLTLNEVCGCFHLPIWTFPDFLKHLYHKLSEPKRILTDLEQKILIEGILHNREKTFGNHFYFKQFRQHPGIIAKIQEFISGIRRIGMGSPQKLTEKLTSSRMRQGAVLEELLEVFALYGKRLQEARVIDETGIFLELAQQAAAGQLDLRHAIACPELLVLEGYYELTRPEQEIFSALSCRFDRSILTLDCPFNPYLFPEETALPKPFHIFREIVRYIQHSGFSVREFSHSPLPLKDGQDDRTLNSEYYQNIRNTASLTVSAYRNRKEEVSEIARTIRTLHREDTISLSEIGIAFPIIEQYEGLVREIFPRYGIPFTMFQGHALVSSPVIVTIFRLLRSILEDDGREEALSCFKKEPARSLREWIQGLKEAIQQFHIPHRIFQAEERLIRENNASALRKFWKLLDTLQQEFSTSLEQNVRLSALTLREFYDLLRIVSQGETYYVPALLDDSVFVMGRLDTRQVQFRYLFFGGLVEKDFPGQDEPNIFLSEYDAETLGFPGYKKRLQETAHLFYLNLLNPTQHLYLSYPLQEEEKDVLRSGYIDRLCLSAHEKQEIPVLDIHSENLLENIYTYAELLRWVGTEWSRERRHPDHTKRADQMSALPEKVLRCIAQIKGKGYVENFWDALKAQQLRIADELSLFDGILASEWSHNLLLNRYKRHVYSVSEFDVYSCCPIKFFFRRILYLEPLAVVVPEIAAPDIGLLLHTIVYRFYTDGTPHPGEVNQTFLQQKTYKDPWIREARRRISTIAQEELMSYEFSGIYWDSFVQTLLAGLSSDIIQRDRVPSEHQGLLTKFIELEANDADKVLPCYCEAYFGMSGLSTNRQNDARTPDAGYRLSAEPYSLHGKDREGRSRAVRICGKIDRIDREPQDDTREQAGRSKVIIYDYKTGGIPAVRKIREGYSFQLPLYILAAQEFLGSACDVVAGGYYRLKSSQEIGKKGHVGSKTDAAQHYFTSSGRSLFDTPQEVLDLLNDYSNRAIRVTQDIRQGRFHPTLLGSQTAGCSYCDYKHICRVDHRRMKKLEK